MSIRTQDLSYYLSLPYRVEITPAEGRAGYNAAIRELQGCVAFGESVAEAYAALEAVERVWLVTALKRGWRISEPPTLDEQKYSGEFRVRLPKYLHRELALLADDEGTSLNQLVVALLSEGAQRLHPLGPMEIVEPAEDAPQPQVDVVVEPVEDAAQLTDPEPACDYDDADVVQAEAEDVPMRIHVEVYLAARALAEHQESFSSEELQCEIGQRFGDTRPAVLANIAAICVANVPRSGGTVSNYLWRLPDGRLRPFDPDHDLPDPTRLDARTAPDPADLPTPP